MSYSWPQWKTIIFVCLGIKWDIKQLRWDSNLIVGRIIVSQEIEMQEDNGIEKIVINHLSLDYKSLPHD